MNKIRMRKRTQSIFIFLIICFKLSLGLIDHIQCNFRTIDIKNCVDYIMTLIKYNYLILLSIHTKQNYMQINSKGFSTWLIKDEIIWKKDQFNIWYGITSTIITTSL